MTDLSIRQLNYLIAIADHLHFGDAAAMCGVSQPNLSAQLRELERTLGVQLVERSPRQVLLTPAGTEVVRRARRIVEDIEALRHSVETAEPLAGRLRLGVIPTITPYVLPQVLPLVRETYPALELHLTEDFTDRLVQRLQDGELDLLLLALPVDRPGLTSEVLASEPFTLALPADHPLGRGRRTSPELLATNDLLLLTEGHCLRDQALDVCHARPASQRSAVEGTSLTTLVQMVANGLGITLLPMLATLVEVPSGDEVTVRRLARPEPGRVLGLVWRSSSSRHEAFIELSELFRGELKRLLQEAEDALPR